MKLFIIAGATASGKTGLAIALAKALDNCPIIYADSRTIYKYLDIGTAKPSPEIRQKIPHHLIDIIEPTEFFNASDFAKETEKILANLRGEYAILTGGTGLYINMYLEGIAPVPEISPEIQKEIRNIYKEKGRKGLQKLLAEKDPEIYKQIDTKNPMRMMRALEVLFQTGKSLAYYWKLPKKKFKLPEEIVKIYIDLPKEVLHKNIELRTEEMIHEGLIEEVQHLLLKYPADAPGFNSIGYKETVSFLQREGGSVEELKKEIIKNTKKYAKRQKTWFNKFYKKNAIIFDSLQKSDIIVRSILEKVDF